jgi:cbb3-type cytochrome oxidase maturation protein
VNADFWIPIFLLVVIGFFSACAAWMMGWSLKTGQFENSERNSACIFDDDEPIGETTDRILK